jgi:hypothetical protein
VDSIKTVASFGGSSAKSSPSRFANRIPVRFCKPPLPKTGSAVEGVGPDRSDNLPLSTSPAAAEAATSAVMAAAAAATAAAPSPVADADMKVRLPPPLPLPAALKEPSAHPSSYEVQLANKILEEHGLQALIELVGRVTESSSRTGGGGSNVAVRSPALAAGVSKHASTANVHQTHHPHHPHYPHHLHHPHQHHDSPPLTYAEFATCGGLLKDPVISAAVQALPVCLIDTFAIKQMKELRASTMMAAAKYDAKQQKLQNLMKDGPWAIEVTSNIFLPPNSRSNAHTSAQTVSGCTQVRSCGLEKDDDDDTGNSAAGVVMSMLRDYSDYFDAMKAAASVTDDTLMQPFVAW